MKLLTFYIIEGFFLPLQYKTISKMMIKTYKYAKQISTKTVQLVVT